MKKLFFTLIMVIFCLSAFAQRAYREDIKAKVVSMGWTHGFYPSDADGDGRVDSKGNCFLITVSYHRAGILITEETLCPIDFGLENAREENKVHVGGYVYIHHSTDAPYGYRAEFCQSMIGKRISSQSEGAIPNMVYMLDPDDGAGTL